MCTPKLPILAHSTSAAETSIYHRHFHLILLFTSASKWTYMRPSITGIFCSCGSKIPLLADTYCGTLVTGSHRPILQVSAGRAYWWNPINKPW